MTKMKNKLPLTITKSDKCFTVAEITLNCECFHCGLHCLSLLFTKSTVDWRGVMARLPLPQRVAKIAGGWGCLFG
jgi:hypothetical protein